MATVKPIPLEAAKHNINDNVIICAGGDDLFNDAPPTFDDAPPSFEDAPPHPPVPEQPQKSWFIKFEKRNPRLIVPQLAVARELAAVVWELAEVVRQSEK